MLYMLSKLGPRGLAAAMPALTVMSSNQLAAGVPLSSALAASHSAPAPTTMTMLQRWYSHDAGDVGGERSQGGAIGGESGAVPSGAGGHEPLNGVHDTRYAAGWSAEEDPRHREELDRHRLLEASLNHVKQLGWSPAALQAGAADLGLSPSFSGSLPRGEVELVEYFMSRCNRQLQGALAVRREELAGMRTTERVREGVKLRLEMNVPVIDTWAQALSLQVRPEALAQATHQRMEAAGIIWHAAGDTSMDYNWYTKRGLLVGVYGATELFMLTDTSPGFRNTWAALDRRLADVLALGRVAGGAAGVVREAAAALSALVRGGEGTGWRR